MTFWKAHGRLIIGSIHQQCVINTTHCPHSISNHFEVTGWMDSKDTTRTISKGQRPSLHKGDRGDFTPLVEVERIQGGQLSPPSL